jgi:hypothetical protein
MLGCHRRPEDAGSAFTNLTPASERQDHTTSPYASKFSSAREVRAATLMRPPHPAFNVRDDRETPLIERGMRPANTDFGKNEREMFFAGGLDRWNRVERVGKIGFSAQEVLCCGELSSALR